jgi:uncharacterized protein (DUF305 family)
LITTYSRMLLIGSAITLTSIITSCMADHSQMPSNSTPSNSTPPNSMPSNSGNSHAPTMNHGNHGMNHGMDLGPADAAYDLRFIDAMMPHHEGAIVMANVVLKQSQRPELKKLAQAIVTAQAQEITQMQQWRKAWYPKAESTPVMWHRSMQHMIPMDEATIKSMRMDLDLGPADTTFDQRFIDAMIPHHEAAVTMAQDLAGKTQRPEMKTLAKNILSSQQAEINQLKQWRKAWYGN